MTLREAQNASACFRARYPESDYELDEKPARWPTD